MPRNLDKRLVEAHRLCQVGLEAHRVDPDDEQTWTALPHERALRDGLWLERVARTGLSSVPVAPVRPSTGSVCPDGTL